MSQLTLCQFHVTIHWLLTECPSSVPSLDRDVNWVSFKCQSSVNQDAGQVSVKGSIEATDWHSTTDAFSKLDPKKEMKKK